MREVTLKAKWVETNNVYRLRIDAPSIAMGVTNAHWWIVGEGTPYNSLDEAMQAVEARLGPTPADKHDDEVSEEEHDKQVAEYIERDDFDAMAEEPGL